MTDFPVGESPRKGLRVWTNDGISEHGLYKTSVSSETGGTIVYEDASQGIYGIQWDTGEITLHSAIDFGKHLICIGSNQTMNQYLRSRSD